MVAQNEPTACPQCGKAPSIMPTLFNTYYVVCVGHCETKGCGTKAEAIALWNRHEYEEQDLQDISPDLPSPRSQPAPRIPLIPHSAVLK